MTEQRWSNLMNDDYLILSDSEISEGWHFCYEFDGLLVGPGMGEVEFCNCLGRKLPGPSGDHTPDSLAFVF